ncbi:hypothetical protein Pgy4_34126, partial [Pseudomonas savastanoi pv. glycinea str. race 4]
RLADVIRRDVKRSASYEVLAQVLQLECCIYIQLFSGGSHDWHS